MKNLPAYTVVIPAYNATNFIAETITSVMAQTHPPVRIVVVDDGSTDNLAATLAPLAAPISLFHQKNTGPGSATSRGISESDTDFIATIDADDLWLQDKIERQLAVLENPEIDMVFSRMSSFGENISTAGVDDSKSGWARSTMLLRRSAFDKTGPLEDMSGYRGEMVDWLARARDLGLRLEMMEAFLARRRVHKGSLAYGRSPEPDKGYMEVVLRAMRRRKENGA